MNNLTNSMVRFCVAALLIFGFTAGTAAAQTYFDPSLPGTGGAGTEPDPYQSGQFQAAIDDACSATPADTIVVLGSGTTNASTTLDFYNVSACDLTIRTNDDDDLRTITLDQDFRVQGSPTVTLQGVNLHFPGGGISLRMDDASTVASGDPAGLVRFSGETRIETGDEAIAETVTIDRLRVEEGATTTFFAGSFNVEVIDVLNVTEVLDVEGTLNAGNNDVLFDVAVEDDPLLSIDGQIVNGNSFNLDIEDTDGDEVFASDGEGELNVPLNLVQSEADSTFLTFSLIGEAGLSEIGSAGDAGVVVFENLETIQGSITISEAEAVQAPELALITGDLILNDDDEDVEFVAAADLEIGNNLSIPVGTARFEGTLDVGETTFVGGGTASQDVNVAFEQEVTFNNLRLRDYADVTFTSETAATLTSVVEGSFITTTGLLGDEVPEITLSDDDITDTDVDGVHNLSLNGPVTLNTIPDITFEGDETFLALGASGSQDVAINTSDDWVLDRLHITESGTTQITGAGGDVEIEDTLRLEDGIFQTNGRLDAANATLVRFADDDQNGRLLRGTSDLPYVSADALPAEVIYEGDRRISTGDELPEFEDVELQEIPVIEMSNAGRVTLDVDYTVTDEFRMLSGIFDLGSEALTLANNATFVRGDGALDAAGVDPQEALIYPDTEDEDFDPGTDGIFLRYVNTGDITTGIEFPVANDSVIVDLTVDAGATVALAAPADDDSVYTVNDDIELDGGVLSVNGQTLQLHTSFGNDGDIDLDGGEFAGDEEGTLLFTGTGEVMVLAWAEEEDALQIFEFPSVVVNKPHVNDLRDNEVTFNIIDNNVEGDDGEDDTDGFDFFGDFVVTAANDTTVAGEQGVRFGAPAGEGLQENVDYVRIRGNLDQEVGTFYAQDVDDFQVDSDVDSDSDILLVGNQTFAVLGNLNNTSRSVDVQSDESFSVDGNVTNSGDLYAASDGDFAVGGNFDNTGDFESDYEGEGSIGGNVNQQGTFVFDDDADELTVGGTFEQWGDASMTAMDEIVDVTFESDVVVSDGSFLANGDVEDDFTFVAASYTQGSDTTNAWFAFDGPAAARVTGDFLVMATASEDDDADDDVEDVEDDVVRNRFYLNNATLDLEGDYAFFGAGDEVDTDDDAGELDNGLNGEVGFIGENQQTVTVSGEPEAYFEDVRLDGDGGVLLESDVALNSNGTLNLQNGVVDTQQETYDVTLWNPTIDIVGVGNNPNSGAVVQGSRDSYVNGSVRRNLAFGTATGGTVTSGYYYPLGREREDGQPFFSPIMLQFDALGGTSEATATILDPDTLDVEFDELMVEDRDDQGNVDVDGLTLNTLGNLFYLVRFDTTERVPAEDPNIRIIADGLQGRVRDISEVRIVQFDCEMTDTGQLAATNPQLAGTYDLFADTSLDDASIDANDFINGVPNLVQEGVDVEQCQIFAVAANAAVNPIGDAPAEEVLTIAEARRRDVGTNVTVEGVVSRALGRFVRLQDETAGITLFESEGAFPVASELENGDSIRVSGELDEFSGLLEILPDTIQVLDDFATPPQAQNVSVVDLLTDCEEYESELVRIDTLRFTVGVDEFEPVTFAAGTNYDVFTNASDPITLRIERDTDTELVGTTIDQNALSFRGVVGEFNGDCQVLPVREGDILRTFSVDNEDPVALPTEFALHGNYPNPFNPSTTINFDLPAPADVTVSVYDVMGREVLTVPMGRVAPGAKQELKLDASELGSGVYLYRVTAVSGDETHAGSGRMVLVK